jgi:hypothetical protein
VNHLDYRIEQRLDLVRDCPDFEKPAIEVAQLHHTGELRTL